ncbi:MAG: FtsX-like permease family protein, partial [Methanosphaera stadtmanae]|nr:FtsX-like permease family protein [Methanosphaera stadtmanae]
YGEDKWVETKVDEIYADPTNQGLTIRPDKFEKLGYNFTPTSIVTNHDVNSSYPGISTINGVDDLQNTWDELMESGNLLVAILLIFAVLLSVVMLYSLSILSFTEIERELATLKVIGFKSKIIQKIFLIQNLALSIIGYIIGIPVGYYVLRVMMDTSGETFYYPIHYSLQTMALTFIAVVILSFIVNLLLVRKIKDIDLVASLKLIRE